MKYSIVMSVFAIVILSVIGSLFKVRTPNCHSTRNTPHSTDIIHMLRMLPR
jgi:hypothetical protein